MRCLAVPLAIALAVLSNPGAAGAGPFDLLQPVPARDRSDHVERLSADAVKGLSQLQRDRVLRGFAGRDSNGYDLQSLSVDMTIDPVAGTVDCTSVLELVVTEAGQKDFYFYFDPFDDFSVSDAAGPLPTQYYGSFGAVRVHYFAAPAQGEVLELTFTNTGVPPCEPDPFFGMQFCMLTTDLFYNIASYFAPGVVAFEQDDLEDAYHVDASMTIPVGYEVAMSLDAIETVDNGDGTETRTFTRVIPVSSPFSFSVAPYDVLTAETADGVEMTLFTIPGANEHAQAYLDASVAAMELYWDAYRPYLFSKHHQAQAAQELGGGVAAASATFYYEGAFLYDPSLYYTEGIFAHELGHQWWGHMVPIKDFYAPWLNEGLTQFTAYYFGEQVEGAPAIAWEMNYYGQYYDYYVARAHPEWDAPLTSLELVSSTDFLAYYFITYEKGAYVMRMLRWVLGEELFFEAMAEYADRFTWQAVTTTDLIDTFEDVAGGDLGWFFDQWVFDSGMPYYRLGYDYEAVGRDAFEVNVTVEQTGSRIFSMPVTVRIYYGEDDYVDHLERLDEVLEGFSYLVDGEPRGVVLDPEIQLLRNVTTALVGDVTFSGQVDGFDLVVAAFCQGGSILDYSFNWVAQADIDGDGTIDAADLEAVLDNFGAHVNDE